MTQSLVDLVFPPRCPGCGRPGEVLCAGCAAELRPGFGPCPAGLDGVRAVYAYEGPAREAIARLKYRNARAVVGWLAGAMADAARPFGSDLVTWVPTTASRRRERGFDQAEILARHLARVLRLPPRALLTRLPGPPQTGLDRAGRREAPRMRVGRHVGVRGRRVLIVDDVLTTGASLSTAAATLRAYHLGALHAVVAARRS